MIPQKLRGPLFSNPCQACAADPAYQENKNASDTAWVASHSAVLTVFSRSNFRHVRKVPRLMSVRLWWNRKHRYLSPLTPQRKEIAVKMEKSYLLDRRRIQFKSQCLTPRLGSPFNDRAAASALSSGRVLKAITALGAALWTALMTASNTGRRRGGRRTPAPITTQS